MDKRVPALHIRFQPGDSQEHRDLVASALLDFETAAVHEISDTEWRVFLRSREERDRAARDLSGGSSVTAIDIEDEDWAKRSQQDLKAIEVGALLIAPPWDVPPTGGSRLVIEIEPSMGFGTGHHATTRLCLSALQRIDLRDKRVLDVGTGSGVLAIAAARLGAAKVTAVDSDPDASTAARDSVRRNGVDVDVRLVDFERTPLPAADVVVANLTGATLQRTAHTLAALARGGVLIVSGLLEEEEPAVTAAFAPFASTTESDRESGWSALMFAIA